MGVDKRYNNLPEEEKKKPGGQNAHNQTVSAIADGSRQPQKSVNEPQGIQQPEYLQYEATDFDSNAAETRLKESDTFKGILKRAQDENEDYRKKSEAASKQAKMQAWGNMFSALGQLAGAGKNTYVAPDQTYLKSALTKADKAREVYDAIKAKNRDYETKYRDAFMENERKAHANAEKLKQGAIADYNKILQKDKQFLMKHDLDKAKHELDKMYKTGQLSLQQYQNETARINAMTAKMNAETTQVKANRDWEEKQGKKFTYTDADTGYNYRFSDGMKSQLADLVLKYGGYKASDFGVNNITPNNMGGNLTASDLKDKNIYQAAVTRFINEYKNMDESKIENKEERARVEEAKEAIERMLDAGESDWFGTPSSEYPLGQVKLSPNIASKIVEGLSKEFGQVKKLPKGANSL